MKKLVLTKAVLVLFSISLFAQDDSYYWYKDEKRTVEKVSHKRYLLLKNVDDKAQLNGIINNENVTIERFSETDLTNKISSYNNTSLDPEKWAIVNVENGADVNFESYSNIVYATSFYKKSEEGKPIGLSNYFYVKLNKEGNFEELKTLASENEVKIIGNNELMPRWYVLSCTENTDGNALALANYFYENGDFATTEPDWMNDYKPNYYNCLNDYNDPYFGDQWGLYNQGQYNSNYANSDINYCIAYAMNSNLQGSSDITVAVIDQGIEKDHPDLPNVTPGYDAVSGTTPSQIYGPHGTACGGIIGAATNNNEGIVGLAPKVRLMPISISFTAHPAINFELANAMNHAWKNGADVISNSWGGSGPPSSLIDNAIDNAFNKGRCGKGSVVTFSSGNGYSQVTPTNYPANSDSRILNVGGLTPCEKRVTLNTCANNNTSNTAYKSQYGSELDLVAPGTKIPTTDLQGADGATSGDYNLEFDGTSAASPHVAGVAALLLSKNPSLTNSDVSQAILATAQKFGPYSYSSTSGKPHGTWNDSMGYGALDVYGALNFINSGSSGGNQNYVDKDRNLYEYNKDENHYSIVNVEDGKIIAGTSFPSSNDTGHYLEIRKLDQTNNVVWSKKYSPLGDDIRALRIKKYPDINQYLITGTRKNSSNQNYSPFLMIIDGQGGIVANATYNDMGSNLPHGYGLDIDFNPDGGDFYMCGFVATDPLPKLDEEDSKNGFIMRIDGANLGHKWTYTMNVPVNAGSKDFDMAESLLNIQNSPNNTTPGYFITGSRNIDSNAQGQIVLACKVDYNGNLLWDKSFYYQETSESGAKAILNENYEIMVLSNNSGQASMNLTSFTPGGMLINNYNYDLANDRHWYGFDMEMARNGNLFIGGMMKQETYKGYTRNTPPFTLILDSNWNVINAVRYDVPSIKYKDLGGYFKAFENNKPLIYTPDMLALEQNCDGNAFVNLIGYNTTYNSFQESEVIRADNQGLSTASCGQKQVQIPRTPKNPVFNDSIDLNNWRFQKVLSDYEPKDVNVASVGCTTIDTCNEVAPKDRNIYEYVRDQNHYSVLNLPNGKIMAGTSFPEDPDNDTKIEIRRLDDNNDLVWAEYYMVNEFDARAFRIKKYHNGFVITGTVEDEEEVYHPYLLLIDDQGNKINAAVYEHLGGEEYQNGYGLDVDYNAVRECFYLCGFLSEAAFPELNNAAKKAGFFMKVDVNLNFQWSRILNTPLEEQDFDMAEALTEVPGKEPGYFITGSRNNSGQQVTSGYKFSYQGALIWEKSFSRIDDEDESHSGVQTIYDSERDRILILSNNSERNTEFYLTSLSPNGSFNWLKMYTGNEEEYWSGFDMEIAKPTSNPAEDRIVIAGMMEEKVLDGNQSNTPPFILVLDKDANYSSAFRYDVFSAGYKNHGGYFRAFTDKKPLIYTADILAVDNHCNASYNLIGYNTKYNGYIEPELVQTDLEGNSINNCGQKDIQFTWDDNEPVFLEETDITEPVFGKEEDAFDVVPVNVKKVPCWEKNCEASSNKVSTLFDYPKNENNYSILNLEDGKIIAGTSFPKESDRANTSHHIEVRRLDKNNNVIWKKRYTKLAGSPLAEIRCFGMDRIEGEPDGLDGFVLVGTKKNEVHNTYNPFVLKLDEYGNIVNEAYYESGVTGHPHGYGMDIDYNVDQNAFYLCGFVAEAKLNLLNGSNHKTADFLSKQSLFMKIDQNLDILWNKVLNTPFTSASNAVGGVYDADMAVSLTNVPGGNNPGYFYTGTRNAKSDVSTESAILGYKLSYSGNFLWETSFVQVNDETNVGYNALYDESTNQIFMVSEDDDTYHVTKLSLTGNVNDFYPYKPNNQVSPYDLALGKSDELIIAGIYDTTINTANGPVQDNNIPFTMRVNKANGTVKASNNGHKMIGYKILSKGYEDYGSYFKLDNKIPFKMDMLAINKQCENISFNLMGYEKSDTQDVIDPVVIKTNDEGYASNSCSEQYFDFNLDTGSLTFYGPDNPNSVSFNRIPDHVNSSDPILTLLGCNELNPNSSNERLASKEKNNHTNQKLKVFPNPIKEENKLFIESSSKMQSITLYNLSGRQKIHKRVNSKEHKVKMDKLAKSVYIMQVVTSQKIYHKKVIIE